MIDNLVFILFVGTTCFEFENCMLWNRTTTAADANVVDRWRGPRFVIIISARAGRGILVIFSQLLLEVTICFESHEAFETGKLIRDDALM